MLNYTYTTDSDGSVNATNATDQGFVDEALEAYKGLNDAAKAWAPDLGERLEKISGFLGGSPVAPTALGPAPAREDAPAASQAPEGETAPEEEAAPEGET